MRNILLSPSSGNFPAWQQRSGAAGGGSGKELESLYKLVRMLGATAERARMYATLLELPWFASAISKFESLYKLVRKHGATAERDCACMKVWLSYCALLVLRQSPSCGAGLSLSSPAYRC